MRAGDDDDDDWAVLRRRRGDGPPDTTTELVRGTSETLPPPSLLTLPFPESENEEDEARDMGGVVEAVEVVVVVLPDTFRGKNVSNNMVCASNFFLYGSPPFHRRIKSRAALMFLQGGNISWTHNSIPMANRASM